MVVDFASPHAPVPAERLFCRANDACEHSGPAISLTARDHFVEHFVATFASALAEAAHPLPSQYEGAVRHATAPPGESR